MTGSINQIVGDLYGCLHRDEPMSAALDVLCSAMGAAHGIVMRTDPDCGGSFATSHHLSGVAPAILGKLGQSEEYRHVLSNCSTGSAIRMTDMVPRDRIMRTEMYQTMLRPLDGGLALCGLQRDGSSMVVTAICRSAAGDPDFDDESVALLRTALPHLVAVTAIAGRLTRERRDGRRIHDALDLLDDGVILLDAHGHVVEANAVAQAQLVRGDRIRSTQRRLVATQRTDDIRLQRAIDAVRTFNRGFDVYDKAAATRQSFQVLLGRRTPGWPLIATVMPVDRGFCSSGDRAILVHLRDPVVTACLSTETLRSELGLTAREAVLVQALAEGASLTSAACQMGISPGTARQYLKTIFHKTGVGGQADLLRLVRR